MFQKSSASKNSWFYKINTIFVKFQKNTPKLFKKMNKIKKILKNWFLFKKIRINIWENLEKSMEDFF